MVVTKRYRTVFENEQFTLTFCDYTDDRTTGDYGYWLYDKTKGMNLSMKAKIETQALIEGLMYYQKRLTEIESSYNSMRGRLHLFMAGEGWEEIDQDKNDYTSYR